jgi:N-acetyl-anhydromuramyl-L-alanine amidase AmpD
MKYPIKNQYIDNPLNRPKTKRPETLFLVAHDTGNMNATAQNHFRYLNRSYHTKAGKHYEQGSDASFRVASAHAFIDDRDIVVTVPLDEKAWHVLYDVTTDNKMFGDDANDAAVGIELCYFADVNRSKEAYKRFVWFFAYLMYKYKLTWNKITFHSVLDPGRKTDPQKAFERIGETYQSFLQDVQKEYHACIQTSKPEPKPRETVLSKSDADQLIKLCQREWSEGNDKEKKEWSRIANKLRELSGQKQQN